MMTSKEAMQKNQSNNQIKEQIIPMQMTLINIMGLMTAKIKEEIIRMQTILINIMDLMTARVLVKEE